MRRILITGASGFLGFRTIEYLVEQSDFQIIAAARTRRDERMIISDRVQYFF
jgi:nucleoside-diphosphate-sugar epimerase